MYNSLSIDLTNQDSLKEFWIKLTQVMPPEEATQEEAAETLDELFGTDPCIPDPEEDLGDDARTVEERRADQEAKLERVRERFLVMREILYNKMYGISNELCDNLGLYTVEVKVARSHQEYPYDLLVEGGEVVSTVVNVTESVQENILVGKETGKWLDLQDGYGVDTVWVGPTFDSDGVLDIPPEIESVAGGIDFGKSVTGVLNVSKTVIYDLVTIDVTDVDGCSVTAIYHLATDNIDIEPPPEDEAAAALCEDIYEKYVIPKTPGDCYKLIDHDIRCNCSNKPSGDGYVTYTPLDCGKNAPGSIIDRETILSYVTCDEKDKVSDPVFYEKVCCYPPAFPLPRCKTTYAIWNGKGISPEKLSKLQNRYGLNTTLVGVGPREGACGKLITTQNIDQKSCCEDVPQLKVTKKSSDSIAPGQAVRIEIEGGLGPVTWEVNGGYTLAFDVTTTPGYNVVSMDEDGACYGANINIKGQCYTITQILPLSGDIPELYLPDGDIIVAPDQVFGIGCTGGILKMSWQGSGGLSVQGHPIGRFATFVAASDFCGTGHVTVTDECGKTATKGVRSTAGKWEIISGLGCDCAAGSGGAFYPDACQRYGEIIADGYLCNIERLSQYVGWSGCSYITDCGGQQFIPDSGYCSACMPGATIIDETETCCTKYSGVPGEPVYTIRGQRVNSQYKWVCS